MRSIALLPYTKLYLIHDISIEHLQMRLHEIHMIMDRNWTLWHMADSRKSMSPSWCVRSCSRSVHGSCGQSWDSSCGGISNCVSCNMSCSESAVKKLFVGGILRHWSCSWFMCPWPCTWTTTWWLGWTRGWWCCSPSGRKGWPVCRQVGWLFSWSSNLPLLLGRWRWSGWWGQGRCPSGFWLWTGGGM